MERAPEEKIEEWRKIRFYRDGNELSFSHNRYTLGFLRSRRTRFFSFSLFLFIYILNTLFSFDFFRSNYSLPIFSILPSLFIYIYI